MSQVKRLMEQKNELARELIQCKAEIERLKGLIKTQNMTWHNLFYQTTTTMTEKQSYKLWEERWKQFCETNKL